MTKRRKAKRTQPREMQEKEMKKMSGGAGFYSAATGGKKVTLSTKKWNQE